VSWLGFYVWFVCACAIVLGPSIWSQIGRFLVCCGSSARENLEGAI